MRVFADICHAATALERLERSRGRILPGHLDPAMFKGPEVWGLLASGAKVPAMPTTYVLGRDGKVRAVFAGYHGEKTEHEVKAALEAALAE